MAADPLIGKVLHDSHKIVRLIGRGGMGSVYEALHVRLKKKRFAVKVLDARMVEDETNYIRFRREAEITTELGHRNIVEVMDFYDTDDGRPCTVMELLEGEDISALLKRKDRLPPRVVAEIARQVGSALGAVHEKEIVHRDLKPGNVFLCPMDDGGFRVKVLDFGISKIRDSSSLTGDRMVLGTPHYMAPEQGEGKVHDVDHRTDIFALGTLCYQMLSGELPFDAPTLLGTIRAICDKPHPKISSHMPALGPGVDRVFDRVLAKEKPERFQQASEFATALSEALEQALEEAASGTAACPRPFFLPRQEGGGETVVDLPSTPPPGPMSPPDEPTATLDERDILDIQVPAGETEVMSVEELFGADAPGLGSGAALVEAAAKGAVPHITTMSTAAGEISGSRMTARRVSVILGAGLATVLLVGIGFYLTGDRAGEPGSGQGVMVQASPLPAVEVVEEAKDSGPPADARLHLDAPGPDVAVDQEPPPPAPPATKKKPARRPAAMEKAPRPVGKKPGTRTHGQKEPSPKNKTEDLADGFEDL